MYTSNSYIISFLDKTRLSGGVEKYSSYFRRLVRQNKAEAIHLLNDENLRFASLFVLKTQIREYGLVRHLIPRNQHALEIAGAILSRKNTIIEHLTAENKQMTQAALRWMLETGAPDDGLSSEFDRVLEIAAVVMVRSFKDAASLRTIVELIFKRHRRGSFNYHLVWAFYESRETQGLVMAADYLRSNDEKDIEMAEKLLNFIPYVQINRRDDRNLRYGNTLGWIQENLPFLYYTGESFQQSCNPSPYTVSMEAKYLCKAVTEDNENTLRSLNPEERIHIHPFSRQDEKTRALLANYSYFLYRQYPYWWNIWHQYPIQEQVRIARTMSGGFV